MKPAKSIFLSKTFWFNLASTAVVVGGVLPPTAPVMAVVAAANIGLRLLTNQPVNVLPENTK